MIINYHSKETPNKKQVYSVFHQLLSKTCKIKPTQADSISAIKIKVPIISQTKLLNNNPIKTINQMIMTLTKRKTGLKNFKNSSIFLLTNLTSLEKEFIITNLLCLHSLLLAYFYLLFTNVLTLKLYWHKMNSLT